ncbi:MAG: ATP-binding protein, partial [Myxococcota bacterium]
QALASGLNQLIGEQSEGIELTASEYERLLEAVEGDASRDRLLGLVRALRLEPVDSRMRRLQSQALGIARRLEKPGVAIEFETDDVRLASSRFREFWSSFVHILRNALDHGIEEASERTASGKAGEGRLVLSARVEDERLVVTARDDGRGIDWERVRVRAEERGLPAETRADCIDALFTDGFTTRDKTTLISGRGVGLGAVRQAARALGGTIDVRSELHSGTEFRFTFPLETLQDSVYVDGGADSQLAPA